jgi:hypothetical protein
MVDERHMRKLFQRQMPLKPIYFVTGKFALNAGNEWLKSRGCKNNPFDQN